MLKVWTIGLVICVLPLFATACTWWNYDDCPSWPPCSSSCGGGQQCRTCESCFWRIDKDFCQTCNELCYNDGIFRNGRCQCPAWRGGACCQECSPTSINHCLAGECGGVPDGFRCHQCETGYHPMGYGNGCQECNGIPVKHCLPGYKECNGSAEGIRCIKCEEGYTPGGFGKGCILDDAEMANKTNDVYDDADMANKTNDVYDDPSDGGLPDYAVPVIVICVIVFVFVLVLITTVLCKNKKKC